MNYTKILPFDLANGTGIRISLFLSGCRFHCPDCFNEESQDFDYGKPFTQDTIEIILNLVSNPYVSGLSINLIRLTYAVRAKNKTIWIWSGFTWEEVMNISKTSSIEAQLRWKLIKSCDVFIDGKFDKNLKDLTLKWRGSSNQRVIDIQQSLIADRMVLYEDAC